MPGKRARAAMRRTTSLTELGGGAESSRDQRPPPGLRQRPARRSSAEFSMEVETAPFLKACGLCRRGLGPGRDIFMYRGDIAFCSLECRQQQMNLDERMEKCSLTSMKMEAPPPTTGSEASSGSETVAAA